MTEEELANQIKQFSDLKKQNAKIDVAALALAALNNHQASMLPPKEKRLGYLISLLVPPFGLYFAAKFYSSGKSDGNTAAYVCVGLTIASIVLGFVIFGLMFSSSNLTPEQLEESLQQYQELTQ